MIPNLTVPALNNVAVRQAMAYAIDRTEVSQIGEYGYEPPANQSDIVTPTFSSWIDRSRGQQVQLRLQPGQGQADPQRCGLQPGIRTASTCASPARSCPSRHQHRRLLRLGRLHAGHPAGPEGRRHPGHGGQPVPATISSTDLYNGNYQLAYYAETGGPTPYYELRQWLYSANSAPIGKQAASNWERYSNPATDKLIDSYGSTTQPGRSSPIVGQLEQVMLKDVPVIPVTEEVDWFQYNTGQVQRLADAEQPLRAARRLPGLRRDPDIGSGAPLHRWRPEVSRGHEGRSA